MSKVLKKLDSLIEIIGCVCFAGIIIVLTVNVFSDFIFGKRIPEADEIVQSFFVWVTYVGAGLLYKNGEQMKIDFIADMFPPVLRKINDIFVDIFTLVISGIMTYYAWILTAKSMIKKTPIAKIPYTFIDVALVIGFATMVLYIVVKLFCQLRSKGGN